MSENTPNASGANPFGQQPPAGSFGHDAFPEATGAAGASAGQPYPSYPASTGAASANMNMADPFGQQAAAAYQSQVHMSDPYAQMAYPAQTAFTEPPLDQPWYGIDFLNATKRFFTKYATFSGRASRGEYWWAQLGLFLLSLAVGVIALIPFVGSILQAVYGLGVIVPSIALSVRRLHDSNLSGWFLLIPYALQALATGVALMGFGPLLMKAIEDPSFFDYMTKAEKAEVFMPMLGSIGIGVLIGLAGMVAMIVLMVRQSRPAGARFDKNPAQGTAYGM